jgi:hypothetical protein
MTPPAVLDFIDCIPQGSRSLNAGSKTGGRVSSRRALRISERLAHPGAER